jgi:hypothetical protein
MLGATEVPHGADEPMRRALERAFREVMGCDSEFVFSGWSGKLTEGELAVVENRAPQDEPEPDPRCTLCGYPQSDCHCNRFGWR